MEDPKKLVGANIAVAVAQLLYTISPIDLVPDFLPVLGQMDDLLGFAFTVAFTAYTLYKVRQHRLAGPADEQNALAETHIDAEFNRESMALLGYEPLDPAEIAAL